MNPDAAAEDLAERIASINVGAPADHIDLDQAVRAGRRRRRHNRLVAAGAFACVVVATVAVFLVAGADRHTVSTQANQDGSGAMPTPDVRGPALSPDRLAGRWLGVSLDGADISSWRDIGRLPANLIIGADGRPGQWQVNRACGPLVTGSFVLRGDGSFVPTMPPPQVYHCPRLTSPTPDLVGAVARTAFVTVTEGGGAAGRTMEFLDSKRHVVVAWREDTSLSSPATVCRNALGGSATAESSFTTIERVRPLGSDALPHVPTGTVMFYCRVTEAGQPVRYAVTADGQKLRL